MPEATDQVAILYQDLELFAHALANAESQAAALDALLGVRDLKFTKSKLRNQLHRASMRANSLLGSFEEDPEP
jgi:hypothetical protein